MPDNTPSNLPPMTIAQIEHMERYAQAENVAHQRRMALRLLGITETDLRRLIAVKVKRKRAAQRKTGDQPEPAPRLTREKREEMLAHIRKISSTPDCP